MLLVIGATGNVGRELARELDATGTGFRVLTRDPARASGLPATAERVVGDLDDPVTLARAFTGASRLFLLTPGIGTDHVRHAVTAARAAGVRETRILSRHVIRNILDPLIVYFTMDIGTVLVVFSTIAFVANGIKYPGPTPEWGSMISFYQYSLQTQWWTVLAPGLAVFVTVIAFSLLGDGLRDILDPRSRRATVGAPPSAAPPPAPEPVDSPLPPVATPEVA